MAVYRDDGTVVQEDGTRVERVRPARTGSMLGAILLVILVIVGILFATGFWSANVTQTGALPKVSVTTTDGTLPKVELNSKKIVVGSKDTTVDVPTVGTKKESIAVPTIGVKDGGAKTAD